MVAAADVSQPLVYCGDQHRRVTADGEFVVPRRDRTVALESIDPALDRVPLLVVVPGPPLSVTHPRRHPRPGRRPARADQPRQPVPPGSPHRAQRSRRSCSASTGRSPAGRAAVARSTMRTYARISTLCRGGPVEQVCSQEQRIVLTRVGGRLQRSLTEARAVWGRKRRHGQEPGRHSHTAGAWAGGQLAAGGGRIPGRHRHQLSRASSRDRSTPGRCPQTAPRSRSRPRQPAAAPHPAQRSHTPAQTTDSPTTANSAPSAHRTQRTAPARFVAPGTGPL